MYRYIADQCIHLFIMTVLLKGLWLEVSRTVCNETIIIAADYVTILDCSRLTCFIPSSSQPASVMCVIVM